MHKMKLIFTVAISCLALSAHAQEPINIACAKNTVVQYYTSGEYDKDVDVKVRAAEKYLFQRVAENNLAVKQQKLAMVLDIDDTSISNFDTNKADDFSNLKDLIDKRYEKANSPAIKPVLRLYNEAIANGVSVFFITARPKAVEDYTITNLQNEGYQHWSGLYFPSKDDANTSSKIYKSATRKMLEDQGYVIILNLGDQPSDLEGSNSGEVAIKLPNPMYTSASACTITPASKTCS